jgi:hypothetical protein
VRIFLTLIAALCALGAMAGQKKPADLPTVTRVEFVLECVREREGSEYELINKCSCALDRLAERYTYDQLIEGLTLSKAAYIAGERGATLRDNEQAQVEARKFREAYAAARRACFLQ